MLPATSTSRAFEGRRGRGITPSLVHRFRRLVAGVALAALVILATLIPASKTSTPAYADSAGSVAVGDNFSCAVTTAGGAKCWGYNYGGQLGDGTWISRSTPVNVAGLTSGVAAVATGGNHACALTNGGGVKCWGNNFNRQLGDGTATNRNTPVDVVGLTSGVAAISVGIQFSCAVTTAGGVKCWGNNFYGQLGDGTNFIRDEIVDAVGLDSGVAAIASGGYHSCALTMGGGLKCWGAGGSGELGDDESGDGYYSATPVNVVGLTSGVASVSAGWRHTCALTTAGAAKCWGYNQFGQLGNGEGGSLWDFSATPVGVVDLTWGVAAVAVGSPSGSHTCALTAAGGVKCWGYNYRGQLGDGTTADRWTPVNVAGGLTSGVAAIAAALNHTCALTTGGGLKCWGSNVYGQLGNGESGNGLYSTTPVDVSLFPGQPPPDPSHRRLVFVQGIVSQSQCGADFAGDPNDRTKNMRDFLLGTPWVQRDAPIQPTDFYYFSYDPAPALADRYCGWDYTKPDYTQKDTCGSIDNKYRDLLGEQPIDGAAQRLNELIQFLVNQDPQVKIDIVAHSQGGVVATYWLEEYGGPVNVNSVVTFDSPLAGIDDDLRKAGSLRCAVAGVVTEMSYDSPFDMEAGSEANLALQNAPEKARVFMMRDSTWEFFDPVPPAIGAFDGAACDSAADMTWSRCGPEGRPVIDFYADLGNHTALWDNPKPEALELLGCAVTGEVWCVPSQIQYLALQQGQTQQTTFDMPSGQQSAGFCACDVGSQADLTLTDPSGVTVAEDDVGVGHRPGAGFDVWEVANPAAGTWTLSVYGTDIPSGGETVTVKVGIEPVPPPDADGDGVEDSLDNCVDISNWGQADTDLDGVGDACDGDDDGDAVVDASDNCPLAPNAGQEDTDGDGLGDGCDGDNDNDGMPDATEDDMECLDSSVDDGESDADDDSLPNMLEVWIDTDPCIDDTDGDAVGDDVELHCGSDPRELFASAPERLTNGTDDDGDTLVDETQPPVVGYDCDGDGFDDDVEASLTWPPPDGDPESSGAGECNDIVDDDGDTIVNDGCPQPGTGHQERCASAGANDEDDDQWPADFNDDGRLSLQDINLFASPIRHFNLPANPNHLRWNLNGGTTINLSDVSVLGTKLPPMFGEQRAWNNSMWGSPGACPAD